MQIRPWLLATIAVACSSCREGDFEHSLPTDQKPELNAAVYKSYARMYGEFSIADMKWFDSIMGAADRQKGSLEATKKFYLNFIKTLDSSSKQEFVYTVSQNGLGDIGIQDKCNDLKKAAADVYEATTIMFKKGDDLTTVKGFTLRWNEYQKHLDKLSVAGFKLKDCLKGLPGYKTEDMYDAIPDFIFAEDYGFIGTEAFPDPYRTTGAFVYSSHFDSPFKSGDQIIGISKLNSSHLVPIASWRELTQFTSPDNSSSYRIEVLRRGVKKELIVPWLHS